MKSPPTGLPVRVAEGRRPCGDLDRCTSPKRMRAFSSSMLHAWRCAAIAASQLGGEHGLQQARELAQVVQDIATAHLDFAAHAGLQQEHAEAWSSAAFAGHRESGIDGLQALEAATQ